MANGSSASVTEGPFMLRQGGAFAGESGFAAVPDPAFHQSEQFESMQSGLAPADGPAREAPLAESLELDPYAGIRPALSPEIAHLTADEFTSTFGRTPAVVALHWLLASSELQHAALAALLGRAGARSVRVNRSHMPIARYLRLVSRLCRETAEQTEQGFGEVPTGAEHPAAEFEGASFQGYEPEASLEDEVPAGASPVTIGGSVGRGGQNRPDDVRVVQTLLNHNMPAPLNLLDVNGICGPQMVFAIETYQSKNLGSAHPDGRVDPGGATFRALSGAAPQPPPASVSAPGKKYTDNLNEVATQTTTPTPRAVVDMLLSTWPALNDNGARTLTAQFMAETGGGKYCFNWNLGNVKAKASEPHMYLRNVWECFSQARANAEVEKYPSSARIPTAEEIKQHGWKCPDTVVVYSPPHPQCRFRAYASLQDGAQRWLGLHQRITRNNPDYLTALNDGNVAAAAHALKQARYYTAGEQHYAAVMTQKKKEVDRALG
jgi:hypothetical protein